MRNDPTDSNPAAPDRGAGELPESEAARIRLASEAQERAEAANRQVDEILLMSPKSAQKIADLVLE